MNDDLALWQKVADYLRGVLNPDVFSRWIEIITPVSIQDKCFVLNVENDFYKDWLEKHYKSFILDALTVVSGREDLTVRFDVLGASTPKAEPKQALREVEPPKKVPRAKMGTLRASTLNPTFTFENFVAGPSNSFAHAAALAVSEAPGRAYNPLFIHGQTGIGKTHLMQAVGHQVLGKPGMSVCYVSSETLLNEYVDALAKRTTVEFRHRYRRADVLLVDDIQFLGGKEGIQGEFFHTFNELYNDCKQIILTSDLPPKNLKGLEERLISRFECGMVAPIESPDFETRLAILRYKNSLGTKGRLNDDVLTFIAHNITSNVRCLEGALTRTVAFAALNSIAITPDMLPEILKHQLSNERKKDLTCEEIKRAVVDYFDLRMTDMSSTKRMRDISEPRQVAMFLCCKLTTLSLQSIGNAFDKNHSTVLHASKTIQARIQVDKSLFDAVKKIVTALGRDPSTIDF